MFTHEEIWRAIERLAERNGLSTSGLAKKAGLDATTFNKSKRISPEGKPRWPSTESLSRILGATDTSMDQFLGLLSGGNSGSHWTNKEMALETAKILLDTRSILFNASQPFTYTSGRVGPVYIDCRRLISFPASRDKLMNFGAHMLRTELADDKIDLVAGGETAGIPYAAMLAERLGVPMLYVRKKPKGFGRMAQIEGHMDRDGQHVVLVEDLQTDGGSKKIFVDALRQAGATVKHAFVIFHYGIFSASEKNMEEMGLTLHALTTWWDVLEVARTHQYFDEKTLASVESFLKDPVGWSVQHGGRGDMTESA